MASETVGHADQDAERSFAVRAPEISLPKGGGALRGIGEKFAANPVTGTGSLSVPLTTTPGRNGFGASLQLSYDSGAGNGPFGFGWSLALPAITRKTDKGLPRYVETDSDDSDVYLLSGVEDLVPELDRDGVRVSTTIDGFLVHRYRPRIEGLFARIERWTDPDTRDVHWRSISPDNVLTVYGRDASSRVADTSDPNRPRVFSWLISESRDDRGNGIFYSYKAEDGAGVDLAQAHEQGRGDRVSPLRFANRYIKRIRYGNRTSLLDGAGRRPAALAPATIRDAQWMFEVVFDYGEHDANTPVPDEPLGVWPCRQDPFSSYRAGFEVRTYRLCRRVLMFHHFADVPEVGVNCLVRSTDFSHSHDEEQDEALSAGYAFLTTVTERSYIRDGAGYLSRSLPPLALTFSEPTFDTTVRDLDVASAANLPLGLDTQRYQWIDLDGEGLSGILVEQDGAWYFKRNVSQWPLAADRAEARFAPTTAVARSPSFAHGVDPQLLDLEGTGRIDLVTLSGGTTGYFAHAADGDWLPFHPFGSMPVIDWNHPHLRFIDLTGDGRPDILISEDDAFCWYPSRGADGFGQAQRVGKALDEAQGPRLLVADPGEAIFLADMSGDGLTDLVRIRNGEVCYWPNLGYGRFGARVTMDGAPQLDAPDVFTAGRVRLADLDGSGTADLVYLARGGVQIYLNRSGNTWSAGRTLDAFPELDRAAVVSVVDLLGNGTACLVWSSALPAHARRPLRYVDLMNGQKPHLLTRIDNNLGAETTIEYAPSTRFYLRDRLEGRPWTTRLPFPVHCVTKVTARDKWRNTAFSSSYSYHHGCFDAAEREFRGFGRVEQVDIESFGEFAGGNVASPFITADRTLYQPPVKTVTWYHPGLAVDGGRSVPGFDREYFPAWLAGVTDVVPVGDFVERRLPTVEIETAGLDADEWREAIRACKGMALRQEISELDVDALERGEHVPVRLFSSQEHSGLVRCVQRRGTNRHAVFLSSQREALSYHYELDLRGREIRPDPRVTHSASLRFDQFGHALQALTVVYPRAGEFVDGDLAPETVALVREMQRERHVAYVEVRFTTEAPGDDHNYRLRESCETITCEVTGIAPRDRYFSLDELLRLQLSDVLQPDGAGLVAVPEIPYQQVAHGASPQRRVVQHERTLFFKDDGATLDQPLPFGSLGIRGLRFETYRLALTDALLTAVFAARLTAEARLALTTPTVSGYLTGAALAARFPAVDTTGQFWARSGVAGFAADATQHFFLPERYTDPFGGVTTVEYDAPRLMPIASTDAAGNTSRVTRVDYRLLSGLESEDVNGNRSEVSYDILGLPIATAVKGKGGEADTLAGLTTTLLNPTLGELSAFFDRADLDEARARTWLGSSTTRHVYSFGAVETGAGVTWAAHPPCHCTIARATHTVAVPAGEQSVLDVSFDYCDSRGSAIVSKVQAEPEVGATLLRWVASGKTVLNNKDRPVKQYEPYFSAPAVGHRFEEPLEVGFPTITYYDAGGRIVRQEMPDGTVSRVEFSPWEARQFDQNDCVGDAGNVWFQKASALTAPAELQRAARLTADHGHTPTLVALDSLNRPVVTVAHNRVRVDAALQDERHVVFTRFDAEGKPLWMRDPRGNLVTQMILPLKPTRAQDEVDPSHSERMPLASVPCYDIAGAVLYHHSMDGGDRWTLADSAGKAMFEWTANQRRAIDGTATDEARRFETRYDALRRPTGHFLVVNGGAAQMVARFEYGDGLADAADARARNLRGQLHRRYDPSGLAETVRLDFSGNALETRRRLARDYKAVTIDWQTNPELKVEDETFVRAIDYDAFGRPTRLYNWHRGTGSRVAVHEPRYNERGLLKSLALVVGATKTANAFAEGGGATRMTPIASIAYDAKGQRQSIAYGNGTTTRYAYEPETLRLVQIRTTRSGFDPSFPEGPPLRDARVLQNLRYTYDPIGNVTSIRDDAYEPAFFDNQQVEAHSRYAYDAIYRLVSASGRENGAAVGAPTHLEAPPQAINFPTSTANTLRNYTDEYRYDVTGNLTEWRHLAAGAGAWTRTNTYEAASNRIATTATGNPVDAAAFRHDPHGNLLNLANVADDFLLRWDYRDMLATYNRGGGGRVYYNYNGDHQRTRKVNEKPDETGKAWERICLGNFELFRKFSGATVVEEIETLHVDDATGRVLIVDDVLQSDTAGLTVGPHQRYQYNNHLGSASLELDETAAIISYEEYSPFGGAAFRAVNAAIRTTAKRYRFCGRERDEESGLDYHGARYAAPVLGRWLTCDPMGLVDGANVYVYCRNNPVRLVDPNGHMSKAAQRAFEKAQHEQHNRQYLSPDEIGDVYKKPEDAPKTLDPFYRRSAERVLQEQRRMDQGAANRAQRKADAQKQGIVTKHQKWEAAKRGARNWVIDRVKHEVATKSPQTSALTDMALDKLRAPEPKEYPTTLLEHEEKDNYEAMQTTLTVIELAASFVVPMAAESALATRATTTTSTLASETEGSIAIVANQKTTTLANNSAEAQMFRDSVAANREFGQFKIGSHATDFKGGPTSVQVVPNNPAAVPFVTNTLHTHPQTGVALFSHKTLPGEIRDIELFRANNFKPGTQHSVLGYKWPNANQVLTAEGLQIEDTVVKTTITQRDLFKKGAVQARRLVIGF